MSSLQDLLYDTAMTQLPTLLEVAIASPLRRSFDYLLPDEFSSHACAQGARVQVPFGKTTQVGIILKTKIHSDCPYDKLKPAYQILDDQALLNPAIIKLCLWASEYYHHSLGEILTSCLPTHLRKGKPVKLLEPTSAQEDLATVERPELNDEQRSAVNAITEDVSFNIFLLEGVTGSGKTEVYLSSIEQVIQQNKQALILVPEIGLTPQTVERFQRRFCAPMSILHSGLTEKERLHEWLKAKEGISKIIIGTRSAILTPLPNLGMIIIDEEHDSSFKQASGFRYCARSVGIMRAKIENVPIILGTATPSLETLYNAEQGRYQHCKLTKRAGTASKPHYHLIDIRHKNISEGISDQLLKKIQLHLTAGNQVLLFLNRRGYAPTLICHECGWTADCPHCDAKMTYHASTHDLHCHHCSTRRPRYPHCLSCKSKELITLGVGTEKLDAYLQEQFPDIPVLRIDRDTTRKRDAMQEKMAQIHSGARQILVGTQMLAKGHHFPNVTLVGIIDADAGLLSADFRALEKLGQTLLQVAGRAGREEKKGEVYLQTHCPNNPLLQKLLHEGYSPFAQSILQQRHLTKLPPYSYLVMIRSEANSISKTEDFLKEAKKIAAQHFNDNHIQVFGPLPAAMLRKSGQYRAQLLFKSGSRQKLQQCLHMIIPMIEQLPSSKKVRWSIDVDPQEILQ